MNALTLTWAELRHRPLPAALTMALLALGVALMVLVLVLGQQFRERMRADLAGIDLVVGAKGSPLQLVLSTVYHVDVPTGNIPADTLADLRGDPQVALAVPLALGDAVAGFRIVGSDDTFSRLYDARLAHGHWNTAPFEAVIGAAVARRSGLSVGSRFTGHHGLTGDGDDHEDHPYTVSGVLAAQGSVIDRLVLTDVGSVQAVHAGNPAAARELTAIAVRYATPLAAMTLPRRIDAVGALQAASPALEINRLLALVGIGEDVLRGVGVLLLIVAGVLLWIVMNGSLERLRYERAVFRSLGASRGQVAGFTLTHALVLGLIGGVLGVLAGHMAIEALATWLRTRYPLAGFSGSTVVAGEVLLPLVTAALAVLAAAPQAWQAYRQDVAATLAQGR